MIDADGLWLVQNEPETVIGYDRAVLTPNVMEFGRLCDAMVRHMSERLKSSLVERRRSSLHFGS